MRVSTTKSKNAESFYITKSFVNDEGKTTSEIIRKLGTLNELSRKLDMDRDGVMAWAREQARIETEKYKKEKEVKTVLIPFHADRQLESGKRKVFAGGYLFLQAIYYELKLDRTCRKIKARRGCGYDLNAIFSDLACAQILEPFCMQEGASAQKSISVQESLRSPRNLLDIPAAFETVQGFLKTARYGLCDVYSALDILADECGFIEAEVNKHSPISYAVSFGGQGVNALICSLARLICCLLERKLGGQYTCDVLLGTLKAMDFADLKGQGFLPLYRRDGITDALHEAFGFRTDYQFISKSKMREIQKLSKGRK